MFSEDIDFFNSYARYQLKSDIEEKKNIKNLSELCKQLIKSLEKEEISSKIDKISSVLKLI